MDLLALLLLRMSADANKLTNWKHRSPARLFSDRAEFERRTSTSFYWNESTLLLWLSLVLMIIILRGAIIIIVIVIIIITITIIVILIKPYAITNVTLDRAPHRTRYISGLNVNEQFERQIASQQCRGAAKTNIMELANILWQSSDVLSWVWAFLDISTNS